MYKLVILIEPPIDADIFEQHWPEFLHLVEEMPGLRREAISRIDHHLFGSTPYFQMHELFFDTLSAAEQALSSPTGQAAGGLLQTLTGGRMALFFADHKEDNMANLARYRQGSIGNR